MREALKETDRSVYLKRPNSLVAFCVYWLETVTNLKNNIDLAIHREGTLCFLKIGSYSTYCMKNYY